MKKPQRMLKVFGGVERPETLGELAVDGVVIFN